ncbi:MAG TPA: hypothetical protein VNN24_02330 [Candidatus Binatus sp.]|nr:hypothetical protein [Candidatus Binatus sp.]
MASAAIGFWGSKVPENRPFEANANSSNGLSGGEASQSVGLACQRHQPLVVA